MSGIQTFFFSLLMLAMTSPGVQAAEPPRVARAQTAIVIGPTVQVSKDFPNNRHALENLAEADPVHPGRLVVASIVSYQEANNYSGIHCYTSFDGGRSWELTVKAVEGWHPADPTVAYGQGDNVYAAYIVQRDSDEPEERYTQDPRWPSDGESATVVYKSSDGGRTWKESARFKFADRPYLAVDTTDGRYAGRVYVVGTWVASDLLPGHLATQIWRSLDGGRTFLGPLSTPVPEGTDPYSGPNGKPVVLADGTLAVPFLRLKSPSPPPGSANAELHLLLIKDGGESVARSNKILDLSQAGLPQLGLDPGSAAFKGRLYAVFPAVVDGRTQIQLVYSADQGNTWSNPVTVNDDRRQAAPEHMLPAIAVNRAGAVMVSWYDRREGPNDFGWQMRAAVSLDGGETFSAGMPVTNGAQAYSPTTPWPLSVGRSVSGGNPTYIGVSVDPFGYSDTSGLAADTDGVFHAFWVDNRTGIQQMYSAALTVHGLAMNRGSRDLAALGDVTEAIAVHLSHPRLDRASGKLTVTVHLQNRSARAIAGPLKMRVVDLDSQLGTVEITNADNGERGSGAVWDFSSQLSDGALAAMQLSAPKTLMFHISDMRPLQGRDPQRGLLQLETHIYGKWR